MTINHNAAPKPLTSDQEKCRAALFLTHPEADRDDLISQKGIRVTGTCEWIRIDDNYKSWLNGDLGLLWISGGPGKGKTVMSIFLTEEMEDIARRDDTGDVIFLCTFDDTKRNTATAVLRGLLYQLVAKRPHAAERIVSYFNTDEETHGTVSSRETLCYFPYRQ